MMSYLSQSNVRASIIISVEPETFRNRDFQHPSVAISPSEGDIIIRYILSTAEPKATIDFQRTELGMETPRAAPAVSEFSSRGPARSFPGILKPDIMAPGNLILAAYNPNQPRTRIGNNIFLSSDYTLASGTSMSCPHISGIAALLKSLHPEWSPAAIQSAMMTTANHLDNSNQPIKDEGIFYLVATPLAIGAGQVDPNRALDPGLVYDATPQDYANLICAMNYTSEQTRTIIRSGYNCSNPSLDLNYPSFIALYTYQEVNMTRVQKFRRTLTNVWDGETTYKLKIEAPNHSTIRVSPQILVFKKKYEKKSFSLTIRFRVNPDLIPEHGSITWIDEKGNHRVRSPIVLSFIQNE